MQRERSRVITVGALILAALGLVIIGSQSGFVRQVTGTLMEPLAPVANLFTQGANTISNAAQPDESPEALKKRNDELEHTVAGLQVEIVRLREIEQDYKRLSGLVDYSRDNPDQTLVTADVVGRDTSGYLRWVIINRGARDGIREGNPVISDLGLVGQVEDVAADASWVRLAIDPSSTINARLQNSRAEGALSGQLQGGLLMDLIPQDAVIETGDLALTSGLGGNFPPGIVIGQVISVHKQPAELFQQADVRPTVDFARLEIVSVITGFQPVNTALFSKDIQGSGQQP